MKINLHELNSLPQRRLRFGFNENLTVDGAVKPVVGELLVSSSVGGIRLRGTVNTLLKLSCHVCLRPYFQALTVDIDEQFAYLDPREEENAPREKELQKDDFFEPLPADGCLDIDDVVYQAVTLAAPVFCRCGDECPGCPDASNPDSVRDSGDDSPAPAEPGEIDPRWKNLKTLLHKQESGENS
ncbi:MAG: DUF177 domain-containing protein [Candidatus Obscuribacterales bacterium]|nr:DUF177 domain-containing protein [Cyanobacteria bacterium HKST-UBA01]MCB9468673.1 DUF177 domain-containing protein [Candidatus Obscuribacterales bacterium]